MTETTSDWDTIIVQPLMTTLAGATEGDLRAFIELAVRRAEALGEAGLELFTALQAEMAERVRSHRVMVEGVGEAWEAQRQASHDPNLQTEIVERARTDGAFANNVSEAVEAQERRDPIEAMDAIKAAEALMQQYRDAIKGMDAAKAMEAARAAEAVWRDHNDAIKGMDAAKAMAAARAAEAQWRRERDTPPER